MFTCPRSHCAPTKKIGPGVPRCAKPQGRVLRIYAVPTPTSSVPPCPLPLRAELKTSLGSDQLLKTQGESFEQQIGTPSKTLPKRPSLQTE
jgi:hypothetical protein